MSTLTQTGTITDISAQEIHISLDQKSSCGACAHLKDCALKNCQKRLITLPRTPDVKATIGQQVTLSISTRQSWLALAIGFLIPLGILVACLGTMSILLHQTDNFSALAALLAVAVYYVLLFLFKPKLNKTFAIRVSSELSGE